MHTIKLKTGEFVDVKSPSPSNHESFFIMGIHKSGSTLISRIFKDVCNLAGISHIAIEEELFDLGLTASKIDNSYNVFKPNGYCYNAFRQFWPDKDTFDFSSKKKVLLVRDPRDAMISYYFSAKSSHVMPKNKDSDLAKGMQQVRDMLGKDTASQDDHRKYIDFQGPFLKQNIRGYIDNIDSGTRVYRYEDVIFNKKAWLDSMLDYLGISLSEENKRAILDKHDVIPDAEDSSAHIRSVAPGNHKKHYSHETIEYLNDFFSDELSFFGYMDVPYYQMTPNGLKFGG